MSMKQKIADIIRKDVECTVHDILSFNIKYTEKGALQAADEISALLEPNEDMVRKAAIAARAARMDFLNKANDLRKECIEEAEYVGIRAALREIKSLEEAA